MSTPLVFLSLWFLGFHRSCSLKSGSTALPAPTEKFLSLSLFFMDSTTFFFGHVKNNSFRADLALKNHRGRPGRSYYELQPTAAAKQISADAAIAAVLPELSSTFSLKERDKIFFLVQYIIFASLPECVWLVGSKVQSRQPQVCHTIPGTNRKLSTGSNSMGPDEHDGQKLQELTSPKSFSEYQGQCVIHKLNPPDFRRHSSWRSSSESTHLPFGVRGGAVS